MGRATPPIVVVIGVAGSGKSTIGRLLADRLGVSYAEADSFHPPANIAKMSAGQPLDDEDRRPWLAAIGTWITTQAAAGHGGVVSCSALKRRYRDVLRAASDLVWFLHLHADPELIANRVAGRAGHFMPASLVASQFEALEPLAPDERGAVIDAATPPEEIVAAALDLLAADSSASAANRPPAP